MTTIGMMQPPDRTMAPAVRSSIRARRVLLACGILTSLLYLAMMTAIRYDGYSAISQTVSELSAIGAPTRTLWVSLAMVYTALLIAFGFGVWQAAGRNRPLRIVGGMLLASGIFGLAWPPMHQREVFAAGGGSLTDTLHIVWTIVNGGLTLLTIGFGAASLGKRFRKYSVATMVILLACGFMTGLDAPRIQADLPTPWVGLWERILIAAQMLWVAVLALTCLRRADYRAGGSAS